MKITEKQLKKMILEEFNTVTTETYDDPSDLLDPNVPLQMSKDLELFLDEVLKTAEQQLGITADDTESDDTYSLLLSSMTPGSELVGVMANALAEMYKSGNRGIHDDPLSYGVGSLEKPMNPVDID